MPRAWRRPPRAGGDAGGVRPSSSFGWDADGGGSTWDPVASAWTGGTHPVRMTPSGRRLRPGAAPRAPGDAPGDAPGASGAFGAHARREVHVGDALAWISAQEARGGALPRGACIVASLPDIVEYRDGSASGTSEAPTGAGGPEAYSAWLERTAGRLLRLLPRDGVAVFCQTDTVASVGHRSVAYVDKAFVVGAAAASVGAAPLWHRIVCKRAPGSKRYASSLPGYSHLVAYASPRMTRDEVARRFFGPAADAAFPVAADVLESRGDTLWARGMGYDATLLAATFCMAAFKAARRAGEEGDGDAVGDEADDGDEDGRKGAPTVYNPFAGEGTVLAVANAVGAHAVGIEMSPRRADKARQAIVL